MQIRNLIVAAAIAASAAAAPIGAAAQSPAIVITGQPTCADCRIVTTRVTTLGATDGPGALADESTWITRDGRGRYYASSHLMPGITVFDSTGRYIRTLGRKGSGPGEYQSAGGIVELPRSQLAIVDGGVPRITILDTGYTVVRTIPLTIAGSRAIALRGGRAILFNAPDARRGNSSFVLDVATGTVTTSFGAVAGATPRNLPEGTLRSLATDPRSGAIWTSFASRYLLEQWSGDGKPLSTVERRAGWFVPPPPVPEGEDRAPSPVVIDIAVDDQGRLWVLSRVADSRWKSAIVHKPKMRNYSVTDHLRFEDTIIEVLDPRAATVIASTRFDQPLSKFLGGGLVASSRLDADDRPVVDVMRLELATGSRR